MTDEPEDKPNPNAKVEPPMATFIQPKITGYRQLGKAEADLMNEAKALGAAFENLIRRLRNYHEAQREEAGLPRALGGTLDATARVAELGRLEDAEPARWLAMGRTDIQTGVMKIVRSIAQPAS